MGQHDEHMAPLASIEFLRQAVQDTLKLSIIPITGLCLDVAHKAGLLAEILQWKSEEVTALVYDDIEFCHKMQIAAGELLVSILRLSAHSEIDLGAAAVAKIDLNARKYPAQFCKGLAHKYDYYTAQTGIKKEGQSLGPEDQIFRPPPWDARLTISDLQTSLQAFVLERNWEKYHTPRNLLLALVGEVGELCEIVQATPAGDSRSWPQAFKNELGQEIADVFIYLLRFADVCRLDLAKGMEIAIASGADKQLASKRHVIADVTAREQALGRSLRMLLPVRPFIAILMSSLSVIYVSVALLRKQ